MVDIIHTHSSFVITEVSSFCVRFEVLVGCLTVHLPHEIMCNATLMQQGNFVHVFLARHVSGAYAHHQEH